MKDAALKREELLALIRAYGEAQQDYGYYSSGSEEARRSREQIDRAWGEINAALDNWPGGEKGNDRN